MHVCEYDYIVNVYIYHTFSSFNYMFCCSILVIRVQGGTELAPMSTTSDLGIAIIMQLQHNYVDICHALADTLDRYIDR